jgi:hypothetical protein
LRSSSQRFNGGVIRLKRTHGRFGGKLCKPPLSAAFEVGWGGWAEGLAGYNGVEQFPSILWLLLDDTARGRLHVDAWHSVADVDRDFQEPSATLLHQLRF